jgi:hypothetical protein
MTSKRKCTQEKHAFAFVTSSKVVRDVYWESRDSFIFELVVASPKKIATSRILKLCIVSDTKRRLEDFGSTNKSILLIENFDREHQFQQYIYTEMLPYGHMCPQVYEAGIIDPNGSLPFLNLCEGSTPQARAMIDYLKANVDEDSIGYISMEYIPHTYVQFSQYKREHSYRGIPDASVLERACHAMARLIMTFMVTRVCNIDAHSGNMMTLSKDSDTDVVILIDFGNSVNADDYKPYQPRKDGRYSVLMKAHYEVKMKKKYSIKYQSDTYDMATLDIDTLFYAIRQYAIITYECNPRGLPCMGLLELIFPSMEDDMMEVVPTPRVFSEEWFGRGDPECEENLKRILTIIYHLQGREPPEYEPEYEPPYLTESPRESPREVSRESPREVPREVPRESPREVPREVPRESPHEMVPDIDTKLNEQKISTLRILYNTKTKMFIIGCLAAALYFGRTRKRVKKNKRVKYGVSKT